MIEWSLATEFEATDAFLRQWADAQKLAFSKGDGWIVSLTTCTATECMFADVYINEFWNFKTMGNSARQWFVPLTYTEYLLIDILLI